MIKLIETPVSSPDEGDWCYRKSFVILLSKTIFPETYKAIILKSRKLYCSPSSKKRWKLKEKFKKEGCIVSKRNIKVNSKRRKVLLSLKEIIELGHITDSDIVEELRQVDVY